MKVYELIITIMMLLLCLGSFIFSIVKIFNKNTSKYFIFLCLATGCYFIEELCAFVYKVCGNNNIYDGFQVSNIGFFAVTMFLLAACFGVLDKKVEKSGNYKKESLIALSAPGFTIIILIINLIEIFNTSSFDLLSPLLLLLIPLFPISYFAIKFILLKNKNRLCGITFYINLDIISFIVLNLILLVFYLVANEVLIIIVTMICGFQMAALPILCIRGNKKWKI